MGAVLAEARMLHEYRYFAVGQISIWVAIEEFPEIPVGAGVVRG